MRAAVCAGFVMSAGRHAAQFTIVTQPVCEHENLMLGLARSGVDVEWYLETMVYNRAPPDQCFFWGVGGNKGHHWHGGATMPWQGQQGFKQGDVVGLLLDCDAGTLTVKKNGKRLGVAKTGLTGEFCWAVALTGAVGAVRIAAADAAAF